MANESEAIGVLVVDDEKDIRDGSERILTRLGFQVLKAGRGEEALDILEKGSPSISIVLLDLKMPGMDGLEVLSRIRVLDETILVIVITGYATVEVATDAMKQGATDFIAKPWQNEKVVATISAALKLRKSRIETRALRQTNEALVRDASAHDRDIIIQTGSKHVVSWWLKLVGSGLPRDPDRRQEKYYGPADILLERIGGDVTEARRLLETKRAEMIAGSKTPKYLDAVVFYIIADLDRPEPAADRKSRIEEVLANEGLA